MATTSNLSFLPLPSNIVSDSRAFLLQRRMEEIIPTKQNEMKTLLKDYGHLPLHGGPVTVSQAIGGARDVQCLYWETSILDSTEGIRIRGYTIPELQRSLPPASALSSSLSSSSSSFPSTPEQPLPEALLWLLLTGELPTPAQTSSISRDLASRSLLSSYVIQTVRNFPPNMHPMTQLIAGVLAMQPHSIFAAAYASGAPKNNLWRAALEDALNLIAKLPTLAALIYRHTYYNDNTVIGDRFHGGGQQHNHANSSLPAVSASSSASSSSSTPLPTSTQPLDYAANFARMMGFNHPELDEALRLYIVLHADHEGGNVSAHSTRLVGSSLADPYLAFSAALAGLAGPLHGRANQEVMQWILDLKADFEAKKKPINKETIAAYAWDTLKAGRVIPGYGHAVLRKTDPRYMAQRDFCLQFMPTDPLFHIVSTVFEVVPQVLKEHGKTRNPWPNVDAHSGVLLTHYGLFQHTFYTVLFGLSRAFGVLSQLVWDRALNLPLERPKSVNLDEIYRQIRNHREKEDKEKRMVGETMRPKL